MSQLGLTEKDGFHTIELISFVLKLMNFLKAPGAWNDPDALIGTSTRCDFRLMFDSFSTDFDLFWHSTAVHMTPKQSRTQMTLWAIMAAPLEIGSNILNMNTYDLETYMNTGTRFIGEGGRSDEFCINNDKLCIKKDELCT